MSEAESKCDGRCAEALRSLFTLDFFKTKGLDQLRSACTYLYCFSFQNAKACEGTFESNASHGHRKLKPHQDAAGDAQRMRREMHRRSAFQSHFVGLHGAPLAFESMIRHWSAGVKPELNIGVWGRDILRRGLRLESPRGSVARARKS